MRKYPSKDVRLVFLISTPNEKETQERLFEEHEEYGDLLNTNLSDGHRKLGYKILTGYLWAAKRCSGVKAVAKTDDNVELDVGRYKA